MFLFVVVVVVGMKKEEKRNERRGGGVGNISLLEKTTDESHEAKPLPLERRGLAIHGIEIMFS